MVSPGDKVLVEIPSYSGTLAIVSIVETLEYAVMLAVVSIVEHLPYI